MTDLIERLEQAAGPSRELDAEIWRIAEPDKYERECSFKGSVYAGTRFSKAEKAAWIKRAAAHYAPPYSSSLDAAVTLVPPGFFWTCGLCNLSGHVTIGPDYNGPERERLLREFPEAEWHEGISVDLEPGGTIDAVCRAIASACLQARARIAALRARSAG